ncbi:hypothetical protein EG327_007799 [Venturia inaequalis]|uniref:F-box domain-containing protein n=1 Tax=Venturia inaequalis TaxID=5025 RepID=A0A8H3YX33_VENIN|nr:hypothetical protein EG327_007799 [Venturia inaequalis]
MNLDRLPYDLLFGISLFLDIEDVVHLGNTSPHLRILLEEETLCRRLLEHSARHTLEAELAQAGTLTYGQAIRRIYKRRQALASGTPVSASVIGTGNHLVYNQGIACWIHRQSIQVRDLQRHRNPQNLSLNFVFRYLPPRVRRDCSALRLLHYSDGVLSLLCEDNLSDTTYLLAIEVSPGSIPKHLMEPRIIVNPNRIFVRSTRDVLLYGVHSMNGAPHGYNEWVIQAISLGGQIFSKFCKTKKCEIQSVDSEPVQLRDFPGSDIGTTLAFKIHGRHFYALSNCSQFDVVEVDWTSFYHCIKFPIHDPREKTCVVNRRIYRRQHAEGPVNDSWNGLSLQVDERTNDLMIVEARTEWPIGGSSHERTFYAEHLSFPQPGEQATQEDAPPGDILSKIKSDNANWSPDQVREPWQNHPEDANANANLAHGLPLAETYILARTKFQWYNFTTRTFVDIIEDDCNYCDNGRFCLRLRIGSRKPDSLIPARPGRQTSRLPVPYVPSYCPSPVPPSPLTERSRQYVYTPISTWPQKKDCSQQAENAHDIMNLGCDVPTQFGVDFQGFADERSILYLVRPSGAGEGAHGKIVCISFDGDASVPHWYAPPAGKTSQPVADKAKGKQSVRFEEFMTPEAQPSAYVTIWEEDIPDAHDLNLDQIWDEWTSKSAQKCVV